MGYIIFHLKNLNHMSNNPDAANNIFLQTVCSQRLRQMIFSIAPTRNEGTPSPYPQYSQEQLNMRRKAEILTYNAAKSNTKTNSFTKAQRYTTLINGKGQKSSYATLFDPSFYTFTYQTDVCGNVQQIDAKTTENVFKYIKRVADISNCIQDLDMIPTPTSSSGIPGPITHLVYNKNIPLYNYATNNNAYSFDPTTNIPRWNTIPINNVYCSQTTDTDVFALGILDSIDQPSYNFSFSTPFSIYFSCNCTSSSPVNNINNATLTISSITPIVYFSGSPVINVSPIYSLSNNVSSMSFDVSANPQGETVQVFAQLYSGILTVSNLNLFTTNGFVYDIYLNFNLALSNNISQDSRISNLNYGVYCNLTQELTKQSMNCNITTEPSLSPYSTFYIGGN